MTEQEMQIKDAESAVSVAVLNRMLDAGRPDSTRRLNIGA
jgi:hypothetical protein